MPQTRTHKHKYKSLTGSRRRRGPKGRRVKKNNRENNITMCIY